MKTLQCLFITVLISTGAAFGADVAPEVASNGIDYSVVAAKVLTIALPIISIPLALMLALLYRKYAKKLHLDGIINENIIIDFAVKNGIGRAEQWAATQSAKPSGSEKLDKALALTKTIVESTPIQPRSKEFLIELIEAKLGTDDPGPVTETK